MIRRFLILAYSLLSYLFILPVGLCFFYLVAINKEKRIFVFDIDNTLADTWHSFAYNIKSRRQRLLGLSVCINMRLLVCQAIQDEKNKVVFLSSRRFYEWFITYRWLRSVGIDVSIFDVLILEIPKTKIYLIKMVTKIFGPCLIYVDDLTYNHENGAVKTYPFVKGIDALPIRYFGYESILEINNSVFGANKRYEDIFLAQ